MDKGLTVTKWVLIVWPKIPPTTPNASKNFSPKCLPKPKSLGFKKKLSLCVRSPCSVRCEETQMQRLETKNYLQDYFKLCQKNYGQRSFERILQLAQFQE